MMEPEGKVNFYWGESTADGDPQRTMFLEQNED